MLLDEMTLNILFGLFFFSWGACMGSFLNVVAHRLPLEMSIVRPPSHCPACQAPVPVYGLIPVFGYFLVRRKCVSCGVTISWVYPLIEFICGAGTVFLFFKTLTPVQFLSAVWPQALGQASFGTLQIQPVLQFVSRLFLFYTAVPLTLIDLRFRILPDVITLGCLPFALLLGAADAGLRWQGAFLGAATGIGFLFFIAKTYELLRGREGLGLGDVKYMGLIGALVGWQGVLIVMGLASMLGSVVGIAFGLRRQAGLQTVLPFGPFLAFAALIVAIWQPQLLALFFDGVGG
ncbi:MAG: hypothetical protein RIR26_214 [Pseudomonadota bacterium]